MGTSQHPPPVFSPFPDDGSGFDTDVVVVGLGPAGGTAALALASYGVRVHAVAMFPWVANSPRAHITNQRTVEVLRGRYPVVHPEIWQGSLATFAVEAEVPAGIAVTPIGSEHDERESRQEEVYLTLSGAGTLEVDGETVEMKAGRYVLVPPESKRRPAAGPEGMSFLVIGGVPGDVYEPWTPPDE